MRELPLTNVNSFQNRKGAKGEAILDFEVECARGARHSFLADLHISLNLHSIDLFCHSVSARGREHSSIEGIERSEKAVNCIARGVRVNFTGKLSLIVRINLIIDRSLREDTSRWRRGLFVISVSPLRVEVIASHCVSGEAAAVVALDKGRGELNTHQSNQVTVVWSEKSGCEGWR